MIAYVLLAMRHVARHLEGIALLEVARLPAQREPELAARHYRVGIEGVRMLGHLLMRRPLAQ